MAQRVREEQDDSYYRLAETLYAERSNYIHDRKTFRREYADLLKNLPISHGVKRKHVVDRVFRDYTKIALPQIQKQFRSGKDIQVKLRRKRLLSDFDTKGRIKLKPGR